MRRPRDPAAHRVCHHQQQHQQQPVSHLLVFLRGARYSKFFRKDEIFTAKQKLLQVVDNMKDLTIQPYARRRIGDNTRKYAHHLLHGTVEPRGKTKRGGCSAKKMKENFDKTSSVRAFATGETVLFLLPTSNNKLLWPSGRAQQKY